MNQMEQAGTVVLAIDDDALVLAEVARALSSGGYTCHCCPDADAARVMAASIAPDLIVSDINIGGHSGLELCEQLKQQAGTGRQGPVDAAPDRPAVAAGIAARAEWISGEFNRPRRIQPCPPRPPRS
jgi:CheY-like chemotaxis protein